MAYPLAIDIPLGETGLTLSAQLYNSDGTTNGSAVTSGFSENPASSGHYIWSYASFPDAFRGSVVFTAAGVFKASYGLNPEELVSGGIPPTWYSTPPGWYTAALGAITFVGPQVNAETVVLRTGDDYSASDGRQIDWSSGSWPSLTSGSVLLKGIYRDSTFSWSGTVVSASSVRFQPTAAQTALLEAPATYDAEVQATLASGRVVTLLTLQVRVQKGL